MINALRDASRTVARRCAKPTAAIIGSQSARTTEAGGPCGYDGGKKIKGRKWHIAVDVEGSPLVIDVHPADVQDRDGAAEVIVEMLRTAPTVEKLFADDGYSGPKLARKLQELGISEILDIVVKPKDTKGFSVLYRRWVVERTFAWSGRCRRLTKDFERTIASSIAWAKLAACRFMLRRVARCQVIENRG